MKKWASLTNTRVKQVPNNDQGGPKHGQASIQRSPPGSHRRPETASPQASLFSKAIMRPKDIIHAFTQRKGPDGPRLLA